MPAFSICQTIGETIRTITAAADLLECELKDVRDEIKRRVSIIPN